MAVGKTLAVAVIEARAKRARRADGWYMLVDHPKADVVRSYHLLDYIWTNLKMKLRGWNLVETNTSLFLVGLV